MDSKRAKRMSEASALRSKDLRGIVNELFIAIRASD